jgi:hypothetical protein
MTTHKCINCKKEFKDELGCRIHGYYCDPNPDMYVQAWKSDYNKTGFYKDDPYY